MSKKGRRVAFRRASAPVHAKRTEVRPVIAHAPWGAGRKESLERLRAALDHPRVALFSSPEREPAHVWAMRIWRWCAEQDRTGEGAHWLILQDDVIPHPDLIASVEAVVRAVGTSRVLCFHTNSPAAPEYARLGRKWLEAYWLTGPAYLLPRGFAARLCAWCDLHGEAVFVDNEDGACIEWMWSERRPAWHSIPALVQHDVTIASTLGYDNQPMRASLVAQWTGKAETDPSFWKVEGPPPHIECPWLDEWTLATRADAYRVKLEGASSARCERGKRRKARGDLRLLDERRVLHGAAAREARVRRLPSGVVRRGRARDVCGPMCSQAFPRRDGSWGEGRAPSAREWPAIGA